MNKIAEKRVKELGYSKDSFYIPEFTANDIFDACIECYDQAMQDFLEKACEWWENTLEYNPGTQHIIKSFKNYMENEM